VEEGCGLPFTFAYPVTHLNIQILKVDSILKNKQHKISVAGHHQKGKLIQSIKTALHSNQGKGAATLVTGNVKLFHHK
jgi:hypothetical protein